MFVVLYCSVHEVHGIFSSYQLSEASTVLLNKKGRQLFFCGQQLFSSLIIEHSTVQCWVMRSLNRGEAELTLLLFKCKLPSYLCSLVSSPYYHKVNSYPPPFRALVIITFHRTVKWSILPQLVCDLHIIWFLVLMLFSSDVWVHLFRIKYHCTNS